MDFALGFASGILFVVIIIVFYYAGKLMDWLLDDGS